MNKISVAFLKPGMIFTEPVYINNNDIFLQSGKPLTDASIEKLRKWKIAFVYSKGVYQSNSPSKDKPKNPLNDRLKSDEALRDLQKAVHHRDEFLDFFDHTANEMEAAFDAFTAEKYFDTGRVRQIAEDIIDFLTDVPKCLLYLFYLKRKYELSIHVALAAIWGGVLANALNFSKPKAIETVFSILLQDIGMFPIFDQFKKNTGKLSTEEQELIRLHPVQGYRLLNSQVKVKESLTMTSLQHHENFDGSGYPRRQRGYEITEFSRIARIADSFAAMMVNRPYKKAVSPYVAMRDLLLTNVKHYDPKYLKVFCSTLSLYPIGSLVRTSEGDLAMIVAKNLNKPALPVLMLLEDKEGTLYSKPAFVNLIYSSQAIVKNVSSEEVKLDPVKQLDELFK